MAGEGGAQRVLGGPYRCICAWTRSGKDTVDGNDEATAYGGYVGVGEDRDRAEFALATLRLQRSRLNSNRW